MLSILCLKHLRSIYRYDTAQLADLLQEEWPLLALIFRTRSDSTIILGHFIEIWAIAKHVFLIRGSVANDIKSFKSLVACSMVASIL